MRQLIKIILPIIGILLFNSCLTTEVEGIEIGHNLYDTQGYTKNKKLAELIKLTINKDDTSLVQLIDYWCGGAAGCYDLGGVITQIIYKIGEDDFIIMVNKLSLDKKNNLKGLIDVGLEYCDNSKYSKMNTTTIDKAFPKLNVILGK